ncbi:diguanylate cyclase (GGDEF) domain-containing protein [Asanoa hainanensis]|uniref:Diguanylate cyclase (GGDEF) domain-containing protein n=1 Tax=Asanoa hainanensis TaxID=560556 RepID=A0A239FUU6_9ACTN|nr:EAL domain-containing protein [Asanoa hainanensis]SNS60590.1 diguanylate cyclase (GGDEF) domain-containing protein [Asanoa hainanensis]
MVAYGDPQTPRFESEAETLRAALSRAEGAAAAAYRDTARLIRLLTVIGTPSSPGRLIDRTLTVLSEVFAADVVCIAEAIDDRLFVTASCGLPEDDPAFTDGWPVGPTARRVITSGSAAARHAVPPADRPPPLRDVEGTSAAWIPLSGMGTEFAGDVLALYRSGGDLFTPADLQVLLSMAYRMYSAVESRERGAAIERLAQAGPGLARHLDVGSLLDEAVVLLRELTGTDAAWVLTVRDDLAEVAAVADAAGDTGKRWPRPATDLPGWSRLAAGEAYVGPNPTSDDPILLVPVMRDGTVIAVLAARGRRVRSFGKSSVEIAQVLASYLSVAMANGEHYRRLKAREQELHRRASRDPLTGLANRMTAAQRIDEALANSPTGVAGLLFFDLDKFKAVNDRLGHEAGDELIQQVAQRLRKVVRPGDMLARFGGDEFVLLINGASDLTDLTDMGRRIQVALADEFPLRGERVEVTASIGAVLGRRGTASASAMLRDADAAMYAAKARGTGRLEVFDDEASHRSIDRLDLRSDLSEALDQGQLSVVYQPMVELKSNTIRSFEALARWRHPERGNVPPDVFIPLAEETGAIVPIGAWVLDQACRQLAMWQREFPEEHLTMSVNISAVQLERGHGELLDVIRAAGVDPTDVWLEVTEHMDTAEDISSQVSSLRDAGVHFALDDFGMSYSSLAYLQRFPVEGLKIDRSFVAAMPEAGNGGRGIVRAIMAVADSLSMKAFAEGIETQAQLDALLDLGCGYGQGHLLSPPLSVERSTAALRAQRDRA